MASYQASCSKAETVAHPTADWGSPAVLKGDIHADRTQTLHTAPIPVVAERTASKRDSDRIEKGSAVKSSASQANKGEARDSASRLENDHGAGPTGNSPSGPYWIGHY